MSQTGGEKKGQGRCVLRAEEGSSETALGSPEECEGRRKDQGAIGRLRILGVGLRAIHCFGVVGHQHHNNSQRDTIEYCESCEPWRSIQ